MTSNNKTLDIVIIVFIAYIALKLMKSLGGLIENPLTLGTSAADTGYTDASQVVVQNPSQLSYPQNQYTLWANALHTALFATMFEDEQTIKDIMYNINTDADYEAIVKAYGNRTNAIGFSLGDLPSHLRTYTPELIQGFNDHFAGWNMHYRL